MAVPGPPEIAGQSPPKEFFNTIGWLWPLDPMAARDPAPSFGQARSQWRDLGYNGQGKPDEESSVYPRMC
ncbi:hypothetical protein CS8_025190 [Cupriavidus sp. 8B]